MKRKIGYVLSSVSLLCTAILFQACTALPSSQKRDLPPQAGKAQPAMAEKTPKAAPGAELSRPAFARMPEEARTYLRQLAEACQNGDTALLLSQGEKDYEGRVRPRFDETTYLALLYRIGPYAQEKPSDKSTLPRLDSRKIRSLTFTGWDENGPVIDARGLFTLGTGEELPCRVSVLWKLPVPRIIGREP